MDLRRVGRAGWRWLTEPVRTVLQQRLWATSSKADFVTAFERLNAIDMRWPIHVSLDQGDLRIQDAAGSVVVARTARVPMYRRGLQQRFDQLTREYLLGGLPLRAQDLVVDVGANVGEVGLLLAQRHGCRLVSIEPEPDEFRCLQRNLAGVPAQCVNSALWSSVTELKFYSKNDTGDSSLFETTDHAAVRTLQTTTLQSVLDGSGASRVRLLKLEAEGAEPEILQGAGDWLQRIDYITADVGPERGVSQEATAVPVIHHLQSAGFELVKVSVPRLVCLFRNRASTLSA